VEFFFSPLCSVIPSLFSKSHNKLTFSLRSLHLSHLSQTMRCCGGGGWMVCGRCQVRMASFKKRTHKNLSRLNQYNKLSTLYGRRVARFNLTYISRGLEPAFALSAITATAAPFSLASNLMSSHVRSFFYLQTPIASYRIK
jgi:hypothetical protein